MDRLAVIDLGTNTFHLLIVEPSSNGAFKEVFRIRKFVKLAEDGIEHIGPKPYQRALDTLLEYSKFLTQYGVSNVKAIGTAALRTAQNGPVFIKDVLEKTGINIQLISGDQEAQLIHQGVVQAVPLNSAPHLIMDIGGGSVEFIIANDEGVIWSRSFPIGVAVLYREFQKNDPITPEEIRVFNEALQQKLDPLKEALNKQEVKFLVGASGTFDVLENFLADTSSIHPHYSTVKVSDFYPLHEKMLTSPLQERLDFTEVPLARAEMLVVSMLLIANVLELAPISTIYVSAYAMKEGLLFEMLG